MKSCNEKSKLANARHTHTTRSQAVARIADRTASTDKFYCVIRL